MAAFEDNLPYHAWGSRDLALHAPALNGTDVKVFQTLFNLFVQYSGPSEDPMGKPLLMDGTFGPVTEAAVEAWQRHFQLTVDGVVGPATGATLGQYRSAYGGPALASRPIDTIGESGGDVIVLQNRLNCYRYGSYTGSSATSTFDSGTRDAVRNLQRDLNQLGVDSGVPIDGLVRYETFDGLVTGTFLGGRSLYDGRHGLDTLWLQRFLDARGYYTGALDGIYGPKTTGSVKAFQSAVGLQPDGAIGPLAMYHIGKAFNQPVSYWP